MKACVRRKYGPPQSIKVEELQYPSFGKSEILVEMMATTVNRTDCANLTAKPLIMRFMLGLFKPKKIILGTDFAGVVKTVGSEVSAFKKGDRVFGFNDLGASSQAQFMVVSENGNLLKVPDNIDFKNAAASLEGASYAHTFIHKVNIRPGQRILINGASGGIGSALLQFARQFDVQIAATCDTKNIELIKSLGADKIFDYTKEEFTKSTETYDYVFDAVGKSTFGKCKPILSSRGVYISSELGPYAQNIFFALFSFLFINKKVIFPKPFPIKTSMAYIEELLRDNKFNPVIEKEFTLEEINSAYEYVIAGKKTGNVIVNI
jgi:NADPH:quinone reductase-like Zn-dependent oxidoreductase